MSAKWPGPYLVSGLLSVMVHSPGTSALGYHSDLEPYVRFLSQQKLGATDYVLQLFEQYDIVVLCERDHRDLSQYGLFLSIVGDERFTDQAGVVFTEVGVSTLNPDLNRFLLGDSLPPDSVHHRVLEFQRNCSWAGVWENYNFYYFIRGLYDINQELPPGGRIRMYPSDLPLRWGEVDSTELAALYSSLSLRDSIMAYQIRDVFDELDRSSPEPTKALVIMNYRHAFGRHMEKPSGGIRHNTGGYLADLYGQRAAFVYLNYAAIRMGSTDKSVQLGAIQDGRWDAAFEVLHIEDVGFDFRDSPFGNDEFDIWPYRNHNLRYDSVFTGFVFYLPLEKMECVVGIPGLVDSAFASELRRRTALEDRVVGRNPSTPRDTGELMRSLNDRRVVDHGLDSVIAQMRLWLR